MKQIFCNQQSIGNMHISYCKTFNFVNEDIQKVWTKHFYMYNFIVISSYVTVKC